MVKPIMLDVPEELETERLLIRAARPGDGEEVSKAVNETWNELMPRMPWAEANRTPEQSEEGCRKAYHRYLTREDLRLHVYRKDNGEFVGGSGLHRIDWRIPRFEIGYWCRRSLQGKGYTSEAAKGIVDWAFTLLGANRISLYCAPDNTPSKRIAEGLEMTYEGHLRHYHADSDGNLEDSLVYSMLRPEWEAKRDQRGHLRYITQNVMPK